MNNPGKMMVDSCHDCQQASVTITHLNASLDRSRRELANVQGNLRRANSAGSQLEQKCSVLESDKQQMTNTLNQLQARLDQAQTDCLTLQQQNATMGAAGKVKDAVIADQKQRISELEAKLEEIQRRKPHGHANRLTVLIQLVRLAKMSKEDAGEELDHTTLQPLMDYVKAMGVKDCHQSIGVDLMRPKVEHYIDQLRDATRLYQHQQSGSIRVRSSRSRRTSSSPKRRRGQTSKQSRNKPEVSDENDGGYTSEDSDIASSQFKSAMFKAAIQQEVQAQLRAQIAANITSSTNSNKNHEHKDDL